MALHSMPSVTIIGAGLAGCEASLQLAERGYSVTLCEQKPNEKTPAQVSDQFAELVCSNSLRSSNPANAVGLLKEEMRALGSWVIKMADDTRVPAGDALAVDREQFSRAMTHAISTHPRIEVRAGRIDDLPPASDGLVIVATGPLTADALARSLSNQTGDASLYFYDAMAPIVAGDSIDRSIAFEASRWDKGDGADYLNCPLTKEEYDALVSHLLTAESYPSREFEKPQYFPGCQPVEVIAGHGEQALRFGPLKAAGLTDPRTGRWPYAVVQLRKEDRDGQSYNLVGLQTKLRRGPQKELMKLIPGLHDADILRFGALHRNTYLNAPMHLNDALALHGAPHVHLAGQITGVEGYVESAACGLLVALFIEQTQQQRWSPPPGDCAIGALYRHVRGEARMPNRPYEPQNVHWGLFAPPPASAAPQGKRTKALFKEARVAHARASFADWHALVKRGVRVPPTNHGFTTTPEQAIA